MITPQGGPTYDKNPNPGPGPMPLWINPPGRVPPGTRGTPTPTARPTANMLPAFNALQSAIPGIFGNQPAPIVPGEMPPKQDQFSGGITPPGGGRSPFQRPPTGPSAGPTDTVPAWLSPGEAVLNKNAAQMAGRGNIDYLNKLGGAPGYDQGIGYVEPKNVDPIWNEIQLQAPHIDVASLRQKAQQSGISSTMIRGLLQAAFKGKPGQYGLNTQPGQMDWSNNVAQGYAHGGIIASGGDPPGGIGEIDIPPAYMGPNDYDAFEPGTYQPVAGGIPLAGFGHVPYSGYGGQPTALPTQWVNEYGGWYPRAVSSGEGGYGGRYGGSAFGTGFGGGMSGVGFGGFGSAFSPGGWLSGVNPQGGYHGVYEPRGY